MFKRLLGSILLSCLFISPSFALRADTITLDKNNIECETYDTHTGVEIYCNPYSSKNRIMEAINKHDFKE